MIKYFCHSQAHLACEYPNKCPLCNNQISPDKISEQLNSLGNQVSIFFYCPACGNSFVSCYSLDPLNQIQYNSYNYYRLTYLNSFPNHPSKIEFDKYIVDLSPTFCEIYNQAFASETYELNQLSGIGYRKALEFLIKDYCIHNNQDDKSTIQEMPLSQVITKYVTADKIRNLAKASAWIGNDETHYIRKFEDKDIRDLKRFINATVAFITYEFTSDEAETFVNS